MDRCGEREITNLDLAQLIASYVGKRHPCRALCRAEAADRSGGRARVVRAPDRALELGFVELYPLETGCVMPRVRTPEISPVYGGV